MMKKVDKTGLMKAKEAYEEWYLFAMNFQPMPPKLNCHKLDLVKDRETVCPCCGNAMDKKAVNSLIEEDCKRVKKFEELEMMFQKDKEEKWEKYLELERLATGGEGDA